MKTLLGTPASVNLELTEVCNARCGHCYNPWRADNMGQTTLKTDRLDQMIDKIVEAGVFHVILTGGEPLAAFDSLTHALTRLREHNISTSCNTNLMLATDEKCKILADLGLDHFLTSLPSRIPEVTDRVMVVPKAFDRIMRGIGAATKNGIRVSVNMVLTQDTVDQVYETGKLVSEIGAQCLFVTRAVPPSYASKDDIENLLPSHDAMKAALDDALRVKEDFKIMIGSLVSYPLCFLGDLEKYRDFVGRGCPAQKGQFLSIQSNGETHSCVHERKSYGNVFETSIERIFSSPDVKEWHDSSHYYAGCNGCRYMDICETGCRMASLGTDGKISGKDPLFKGPHVFTRHFDVVTDGKALEDIDQGAKFVVPDRIRFRREDGFYVLNIRWANAIKIDNETAEFLMNHQQSGARFTLQEFGENKRELLINLNFKDAVEMVGYEIKDVRQFKGVGIDSQVPLGAGKSL